MDVTDAIAFDIVESSQIGETRREIVKFAHSLGFNEENEGRIALVCAELGTNLLKHTPKGGKIVAQGLHSADKIGLEIFSLDSGNGMNIEDCLADGFSSSGTMGTGLGAVQRISDDFNIYAERTKGSVIQTCIWNDKTKLPVDRAFAGINVPKTGEPLSGDKWSVVETENSVYCLAVDGLGHGIDASDASNLAVRRFKENIDKPPAVMLKAIHTALRGSRGAVGAVAQINREDGKLYFAGLGNISAIVVNSTERKHLTSLNGTLGYEARRFMELSVNWSRDSMLVMHSDGLSSRAFEDLHSVHSQPACVIAAWLFQQYSKGLDDSTVLVYKAQKQSRNIERSTAH